MAEAPSNATRTQAPKATAGSVSKDELDYLSEVSRGGERTFAVILLICAYSLLTMGNTTDASLVTNSTMSELPLINVEVPIVGFYFLMPTLLFGAYVYFHLYLFRLWRGVSELPVKDAERGALDDYIRPWLIATGFIRSRIPELRNPEQPFGRIESAVCIFLAWWLVPVTLFSFGVRYLARHDLFGSAYHALLLVAILLAAAMFFSHSARILQRAGKPLGAWYRRVFSELAKFELAASVLIAVVTSIVTVFVIFIIKGSVVVANLEDTELSRRSEGWTGQCETHSCVNLDAEIGSVRGAFLGGGDLRQALASRVFLVNADLQEADLRSAVLIEARLQGAKLGNVRLQDARLSRVYLDHAEIHDAHFDGAVLAGASLAGVKGQSANFIGTRLAGANLDGSKLEGAKFPGAYLTGARFVEAVVNNAQFQGAVLARVDFRSALLFRTNMSDARLQSADLRDVTAPDAIFRCADLSEVKLDGAYLPRADFVGASLADASLRDAKVGGATFLGARLDRADFAGANLSGADFRRVDLTNVRGLVQDQLRETCMDKDTKLPSGLTAGSCPKTKEPLPAAPPCQR